MLTRARLRHPDLATTIDSQMAVYVRNSQGQLEPVACNDDPGPQILGAEVPLANTEFRRRYFVQVGRLDSDNTGTSTDDVLEIVAIANAVLPTPPGPTTTTSRLVDSRSNRARSSVSRPTSAADSEGRFPTTACWSSGTRRSASRRRSSRIGCISS